MSSFVFLSYKLQPYFKCNYIIIIKIIFVDYEKTFCCLNQTRNASANMTHVLLILLKDVVFLKILFIYWVLLLLPSQVTLIL